LPLESIPWEPFRPLLEKGYSQERNSNAGRKRIDPFILFKMLVLQQLFNLGKSWAEFEAIYNLYKTLFDESDYIGFMH